MQKEKLQTATTDIESDNYSWADEHGDILQPILNDNYRAYCRFLMAKAFDNMGIKVSDTLSCQP